MLIKISKTIFVESAAKKDRSNNFFDFAPPPHVSPVKKETETTAGTTKHSRMNCEKGNTSMATYLDVAVLRCLFTSQWLEEGVDWAFQYIHKRSIDLVIKF